MFITTSDGRKIRMPTDEEDAAITAAAMNDPDALPWTDEQLAVVAPLMRMGRRKGGRPKLTVVRPTLNMRVDAPVLNHLRASGKGWQTRVNALLREAVEQGRI